MSVMRLNIVKLTRTNQTWMNVSDIFSLRKRNCKLLTMMRTKIFFKTCNFVNFKWIRAKSNMPFGSVGSTRQASTSHFVQCYPSVFKRGFEPVTLPIYRNVLKCLWQWKWFILKQVLCVMFLGKLDIWHVNCARATAFIFDPRKTVHDPKVPKFFWYRKYIKLKGEVLLRFNQVPL